MERYCLCARRVNVSCTYILWEILSSIFRFAVLFLFFSSCLLFSFSAGVWFCLYISVIVLLSFAMYICLVWQCMCECLFSTPNQTSTFEMHYLWNCREKNTLSTQTRTNKHINTHTVAANKITNTFNEIKFQNGCVSQLK